MEKCVSDHHRSLRHDWVYIVSMRLRRMVWVTRCRGVVFFTEFSHIKSVIFFEEFLLLTIFNYIDYVPNSEVAIIIGFFLRLISQIFLRIMRRGVIIKSQMLFSFNLITHVSFFIAYSKLLQFLIFFESFCHLNRSRLI